VSLRARFRAKPYPNIGRNICHLQIRRVGNRRVHLVSRVSSHRKPYFERTDSNEEEHGHCAHALPCPVHCDGDSNCASSVGCVARFITFDERVEIIKVPLGPDGDFIKQVPQRCDGETSGPIRAGTVSPDDGERAGWTLWSLANARQRAVDLASGIGLIIPVDPNDDTSGEEWIDVDLDGNSSRGARKHKNETRLPVLFWEPEVVSMFVPFADGFSSYGRLSLLNFDYISIPRAEGIAKYVNKAHDYDHWGNPPTGWQKPWDPIKSVSKSAEKSVSMSTDFDKVTMLKVPIRPVVIAAFQEQQKEALAAGVLPSVNMLNS
jgi:hypothetical protein